MICFKKLTSFRLGFFIFLSLIISSSQVYAQAKTVPTQIKPPPSQAKPTPVQAKPAPVQKNDVKMNASLEKFYRDKYLTILNQGFESPDDLLWLFYNEGLLTLSRMVNDESHMLTRIDISYSQKKSTPPKAEKLFFYNKQKKLVAIIERDSKSSYQKRLLSLDEKINALNSKNNENPVIYSANEDELLFGPRHLYTFTWNGEKLSNYSFSLLNHGRSQKIFSYNYTYNFSRIDKIKNTSGVLAEYHMKRGIDENKDKLSVYLKKNKLEGEEKIILSMAEKYAEAPENHYYIEATPGTYDESINSPISGEGIKILDHPSAFSPTFVSSNLESIFNVIDSKKFHKDISDDRYYFTYEYDTDKRISSITFSKSSEIEGRREITNSVSYYFIYHFNEKELLDEIDIYKKSLLKPGKKEVFLESWELNYNTKDSSIAPIGGNIQKILSTQNISVGENIPSPPTTNLASPEKITPTVPTTKTTPASTNPPAANTAAPKNNQAPVTPKETTTTPAAPPKEVQKTNTPAKTEPAKQGEPKEPPPIKEGKPLPPSSLPLGKASEIQEETQ